jgi:glycosyltransferase involved in cell wall biosynthesis
MLRVLAIYPHHLYQGSISHIFLSLCPAHLNAPVQITGIAPSIASEVARPNLIPAIPRYSRWLAYYLRVNRQINERRFAQEIKRYDAVYIWPDIRFKSFKQARAQQKPIFLERINCFTGKAKSILDTAYAKLKVSPLHPVTSEMIREESLEAEFADFIFCPSPWVKASFLEAGVPEKKLLLSSYGWSPERFPGLSDRLALNPSPDRSLTIVFVGSVCVRKGAHLLMEAFVRSEVKGKLVLCGQMEPVIGEVCKDWLQRPDIIHLPFTENITDVYKNADLFAFPTLEEGSPLVSYEAMAHQLPMLVSPMGAGEIVRDRLDGLVLPPYETEAWADAIRELADSPDLRLKLGRSARKRALDFTFDQVADRRAQMMGQCLGATSGSLQP